MSDEIGSIIEFSEDLSEAEAPPLLPESQYPFSIVAARAKLSQAGKKYAEVGCMINAEDFPPDYDASFYPDGITLYYRRVPLEDNPQARWRLKQFCEAVGAAMSKQVDLNDWIGLDGIATVGHSEWEGNMREEIKRIDAA